MAPASDGAPGSSAGAGSAEGGAAIASALDATGRNPFDEVALEEDVEDEDRQRRQDDDRHERRGVGREAAGGPEETERERGREVVLFAEEGQRPEGGGPRPLELEDR